MLVSVFRSDYNSSIPHNNSTQKANKFWAAWCIILSALVLSSCNLTFDTSFPNTPEGNYDYFFYDLSQSYAYKDYAFENDLSLSQIQSEERRRLDDSWDSLRDALDNVINIHLRDPHVYSIYSPIPDPPIEDDGRLQAARGDNFDIRQISLGTNQLVEWISIDKFLFYGTIKSDSTIGLINLDSFVDEVGGGGRLTDNQAAQFGTLIDDILNDFKSRGVEKIIVDIRSEAGGAVERGKQIASRFVSKEKTFMISEVLTSPNSYTTRKEKIAPLGVTHYRGKPLIVLTNTLTCSGGEMTVLMLQQAEGYKSTIGTPTRGCTGTIIDRELPNGWVIRITTSRTFTPDKTDYFKIGLPPTIVVTYGSADDVLQRAITEMANY